MQIRLSKLQDALETDKLSLNDLAFPIKEIRFRQNESSKASPLLEGEKATRVVKHVVPKLQRLMRETRGASLEGPISLKTGLSFAHLSRELR